MGKVSTASASEMGRKKKKGRPAKNSLRLDTQQNLFSLDSSAVRARRSVRRNPRSFISPLKSGFDDDGDDERKEKKSKLVVGLPEFEDNKEFNQEQEQKRLHSRNPDSGAISGSDSDEVYGAMQRKKRKIGVVAGSGQAVFKVEDVPTVTDAPKDGSPLESGPTPTTPLPDKKLLVFILDRLQKKDTHGVFSEPVDIDELPDYFEVIEQPMDFGTVREKLDGGAYKSLEELEVDVFLICSNAMQYNASDTVFYRQARAIQELAKRDFENLRNEGDDGEPQPKVVRRGRPASKKNIDKMSETSPADSVRHGLASDATLANAELRSCGYNLRKAPAVSRFRSSDQFVSSYPLRNGENCSEWLGDWNNEFPASILRADMRCGKKQLTVDEGRRETYSEFQSNKSRLSGGDMRLLVPVGLQEPLAYSRSLARYAANLGSVAWSMASKRIESILPSGVHYGPGWVDDVNATAEPSCFSTDWQRSSNSTSNTHVASVISDLSSAAAAVSAQEPVEASHWTTAFPPLQQRNGFSRVPGHSMSVNGALFQSQTAEPSCRNGFTPTKFQQSWNNLQTGFQASSDSDVFTSRYGFSSSPDLNAKNPVSSPPQQPDLALQLGNHQFFDSSQKVVNNPGS